MKNHEDITKFGIPFKWNPLGYWHNATSHNRREVRVFPPKSAHGNWRVKVPATGALVNFKGKGAQIVAFVVAEVHSRKISRPNSHSKPNNQKEVATKQRENKVINWLRFKWFPNYGYWRNNPTRKRREVRVFPPETDRTDHGSFWGVSIPNIDISLDFTDSNAETTAFLAAEILTRIA